MGEATSDNEEIFLKVKQSRDEGDETEPFRDRE